MIDKRELDHLARACQVSLEIGSFDGTNWGDAWWRPLVDPLVCVGTKAFPKLFIQQPLGLKPSRRRIHFWRALRRIEVRHSITKDLLAGSFAW